MLSIAPVELQVHKAQKGFVHEGGRLQVAAVALAVHVELGQATQLAINQRRQFFERVGRAAAPGDEQLGDLARVGWLGGQG